MPGMNFHNGCRRELVDLDDPETRALIGRYRQGTRHEQEQVDEPEQEPSADRLAEARKRVQELTGADPGREQRKAERQAELRSAYYRARYGRRKPKQGETPTRE